MSDVFILVVEDEPAVRDAIARDLAPFTPAFRIEVTEDASDARAVLEEIAADGHRVGLVLCDHLLPGERGTDFLIALHGDPATHPIRKVLITGQAGHEDTIRAINEADLDHYIAKPWQPEELQRVVRNELTGWVIDHADDLLPYVAALDGPRLMEAIARRRTDR